MHYIIGDVHGEITKLEYLITNILKQSKEKCDYLIVAVSPDKLVQSYKGKSPIIPLEDRMEIIRAIKYVDEVVIQHNRDKIEAFNKYKYDIMFVGDDWKESKLFEEVEAELIKHGSKIHFISYTKKVSSSKLRVEINKYNIV